MVSLRHLVLPATALLTPACQPTDGPEALLPLSDASSAINVVSAPPVASIDAGAVVSPSPTSPVTGVSAADGGGASADRPTDAASVLDTSVVSDSTVPTPINDAATIGDAAISDGSTTGDANSPSVMTGTCGGSTPHGCWPPKAGNPMGCPPQIHEQSEYYPPLDEWVSCESPYYERCVYLRPDGTEAYCACDLGVHWLCTY